MQTRLKKTDQVNIVTLGCSKNIVDSEFLLRQLESNDIRIMHNAETYDAKTVIINTCGFIHDAKRESINTILQFVQAKKKGLIRDVIVMGCLSERYKKQLEKEISDVDKYFGVNNLEGIIKHLGLSYKKHLIGERYLTTPDHYAYLKISEGCDRKCAFCAIPLMRGSYRSKPLEILIDEARLLVHRGVKELILIAQDLTSYGLDLYKQHVLAELLAKLSDIEGLAWIRLHYAYPAGFPEDAIAVMKERNNICKYLDIPIQHASDKILKLMRRGHDHAHICRLIENIREQIPDITLRTTVLTGYPGEGEKEFRELVEYLEKTKFDRLGVFKYSEEENTYASIHYKDTISERIKSERETEIMYKQMIISKGLNDNKINKSFKVLIDDREGAYYVGRTEGDSPEVDNEVLVPVSSGQLQTGNFYDITITDAGEYDLFGIVDKKG